MFQHVLERPKLSHDQPLAQRVVRCAKERRGCTSWSSPLARAIQTARIVSDVLGIDHIDEFEAIKTGRLDLLVNQLAGMNKKNCVIVVGHEPYLSSWSQQICGVALPLKKGAAAGIELSHGLPSVATLHWFIQPEVLAQLKK